MGLRWVRKLVKTGPNSRAVNIPFEWLRFLEVHHKTEIKEIIITEEKTGELILKPVIDVRALIKKGEKK